MSLVKHELDCEEGNYKNFNFSLKIVYDPTNLPLNGVVYLRERQNLVKEVELPINISRLIPGIEKPIDIDFKPLEMAAIKGAGGPYTVKDLGGLLKEISRKWELMTSIRRPERSFLQNPNVKPFIEKYPELKDKKYREKLPRHIVTEIEEYLLKD